MAPVNTLDTSLTHWIIGKGTARPATSLGRDAARYHTHFPNLLLVRKNRKLRNPIWEGYHYFALRQLIKNMYTFFMKRCYVVFAVSKGTGGAGPAPHHPPELRVSNAPAC